MKDLKVNIFSFNFKVLKIDINKLKHNRINKILEALEYD